MSIFNKTFNHDGSPALTVRVEHNMHTNDAVYCWTEVVDNKIMDYAREADILHEIESLFYYKDSTVIDKITEICADISDWCVRDQFKKNVCAYGANYQSENGFCYCDGDLGQLIYKLRLDWFEKHLPECVPYM